MPSATDDRPRLALAKTGRRHFGQLTEPYRTELQLHCYRMLGSLEDAEDLVQETLLRAWRARSAYTERASFRAWLYKIATNACLDALDKRARRTLPAVNGAAADPRQPYIPLDDEVLWLDPCPDLLFAGVATGPEAHYTVQESVRLAFLVALQRLPPRQRAVLLMRDVLEWRAREVAEQLDMSVSAVNSALHRARTTLRAHTHSENVRSLDSEFRSDTARERVLDRYVEAWQSADVEQLVTLLKADATFAMPPSPSWYHGREDIAHFLAGTLLAPPAGRWRLRPLAANGQPAFALYEREPTGGVYLASAIQVLAFQATQIADVTSFVNPALFPRFQLPVELAR